jgi:hypothetical protein
MAYTATIKVLLDVESDGEACDAMTAILTEQLRKYAPQSCLVDWQYVDTGSDPKEVGPIPADFNNDEDAWPEPVAALPMPKYTHAQQWRDIDC